MTKVGGLATADPCQPDDGPVDRSDCANGIPPMMPGGDMMGGGCAEFLKSGLAITDAEKGVWDAYALALKNTPSGLTAMKAISGGKTSVEQLDAQVAATENRLKALKELRPAVVALYAALTADQKKKADQMLGTCIQ